MKKTEWCPKCGYGYMAPHPTLDRRKCDHCDAQVAGKTWRAAIAADRALEKGELLGDEPKPEASKSLSDLIRINDEAKIGYLSSRIDAELQRTWDSMAQLMWAPLTNEISVPLSGREYISPRYEPIDKLARISAESAAHNRIAHVDPVAAILNQGPPPPQLIGGLTAEQCLERYERMQREDSALMVVNGDRWEYDLTSLQLAAARELWSRRLRAKVKETAKPTLTVMADMADD